MADNYLERRYDEYLERKAKAEKAKQRAWKKRMNAYRRQLQRQLPPAEAETGIHKA